MRPSGTAILVVFAASLFSPSCFADDTAAASADWRQFLQTCYQYQKVPARDGVEAKAAPAPLPGTIIMPTVEVQGQTDFRPLDVALKKAAVESREQERLAKWGIGIHRLYDGKTFSAGYASIFGIPIAAGIAW